MITEDTNRRAMDLVNREVQCCMSSLVSTLARCGHDASSITDPKAGSSIRHAQMDMGELLEQAFELAAPVPDYEEAALQDGWRKSAPQQWHKGDLTWGGVDAQELCIAQDIYPIDREVYEHWVVDSHLAEDLIALGEKVDTDFAGLCVWARTTTGQAIHGDDVIRRVVELRQRRYEDAIRPEAATHA